jgi:hypothetical protein
MRAATPVHQEQLHVAAQNILGDCWQLMSSLAARYMLYMFAASRDHLQKLLL